MHILGGIVNGVGYPTTLGAFKPFLVFGKVSGMYPFQNLMQLGLSFYSPHI